MSDETTTTTADVAATPTAPVAGVDASNRPEDEHRFNPLVWLADRGIFVFTTVLILVAAVLVDGFWSVDNATDVFNRAAPIGIVAAAMTFVVISGNYLDLSVVAQVATAAVILIAVSNDRPVLFAMLLATVVALAYGIANGVAVGIFKANAVIVTLATTFIGLGILRWASGGSIYFSEVDVIRDFGTTKWGSVPLSMLVFIAITLILAFVLNRTTFGFSVRAFGSNADATRLAGVGTAWIVIGAFVISAIGAMIGGFVLAAFSQTAVSSMSDGFEFQALAAIIVGGTSVFGGKGSVLRTLLGVVFVSVLTNVMVLSGWGFGAQQMAIGALILLAVSVDALARRVTGR